ETERRHAEAFFAQPTERAWGGPCAIALPRLDLRDADQRAASVFRRPYDRPALGDRSSRAGPVRERVVARARGGTGGGLHAGSAPDSPIVWCDHLGRHGASARLAADQREHAALSRAND